MRILIAVSKLTGGGAERVASLWARGFVLQGYEVGIVLNCRNTTSITYEVPQEVPIYNIWSKYGRISEKLLGTDITKTFRFKGIIRRFNPDVIIGVMRPWAEVAYKATKGSGIKIINTEHNSFKRPDTAPMAKADCLSKFELNKHYSKVTVLTEADKRCVSGILNNVVVMPNPLPYEPASVMPTKNKIIMAAGRLDAWYVKGFDVLIKAWGKIADENPDWKLVIAGEGKEESLQFLQEIAEKYHFKEQLQFVGYIDDLLPLYRKSSIYVLSSRYEGFGMALIEAMSQGCAPIVCDYHGRQREIVTSEKEGLICETDDVKTLSDAMSQLINDDESRRQIQQNAIERSKYYQLDHIMEIWNRILA